MRALRLLVAAKTSVLRTVPLMRDARVPFGLKAIVVALAVLVVSPVDLFGDIPVLGMLDDAALLTLLCMAFVYFGSMYAARIPVKNVTRSPGSTLATR